MHGVKLISSAIGADSKVCTVVTFVLKFHHVSNFIYTSEIRTPLYYGHFSMSQMCLNINLFTEMWTPL